MSFDIVSLQCPVCGAPFAPHDEKCGYCGSILFLKTDHPKINPATLNRQLIDKHISEYRQDLKRDHADSTSHYGLGVAYFNLGLTGDSVRELEAAARLMPENPNIQSQLAVVLKQALDEGRPGAANKLRDRIEYTLRLDPDNYDALLLKAETDSRLGPLEAIELLQRAYHAHPNRQPDRLTAVLTGIAASKQPLDDEALHLLRRIFPANRDVAQEALFIVVCQRAQDFSNSDPKADVEDPWRAAEALRHWKELFVIDSEWATDELEEYLRSLSDLSKPSLKKLRTLATSTNFQVRQGAAGVAGAGQYLKAVGTGLLKAIGILLAILFLATLVSSIDGADTITGIVFFLSLLVLPIWLPVKEVRKLKSVPGNMLSQARHEAAQVWNDTYPHKQRYAQLLSILSGYFVERWKREAPLRITTDASRSGTRGERARNKAFLASLPK